MKKNTSIINDMFKLEKFGSTQRSKYRRNLRLFLYTPGVELSSLTDDVCVGYYQNNVYETESDTSSPIQENIINSVIQTLVSKIASKKVRPFITTENGTYKDMQITKAAQQFFDLYFHNINLNKIVTDAFRDSCIFDRGVIYIDIPNKNVERIMPWQVYMDPREVSYNRTTRIAWKQEQYPTSLLNIKGADNMDTVTYWKYWNIVTNKYAEYIPELDFYKEEIYDKGILPFFIMNYECPIKGNSSNSIVDLLYGIQKEIDFLNTTIKDASQKGMASKYFVPESSNVRVSKLTNRVGEVVTYTPIPGQSTVPVLAVSDPPIDSSWLSLLNQYKEDAYELVGISQLSATAQKPRGLDSGAALATMEDIESDRFETQLNNVVRSYVDIAKAIMKLFPAEEEILPRSIWRKNITWADIVNAQEMFTLQFSAAEFLSNDPSIKTQQLDRLVDRGYISQSRAVALMDIPDLQQGYTLAQSSINAVLAVIDDCVERDIYDVPQYIDNTLLKEEILNAINTLKAANNASNEVDIAKLWKLYVTAERMNQDSQTSAEMMATQSLATELQTAIDNGAITDEANAQIAKLETQASLVEGM